MRYLSLAVLIAIVVFPVVAFAQPAEPETTASPAQQSELLQRYLKARDEHITQLNRAVEVLAGRNEDFEKLILRLTSKLEADNKHIADLTRTLETFSERDKETNVLLQDIANKLSPRTFLGFKWDEWTVLFSMVIAFGGVGAVWVVVVQVRAIKAQTSGQFLFELELRWRSKELRDAQGEVLGMARQVRKYVRNRYGSLEREEQRQKFQKLCLLKLRRMKTHDSARYQMVGYVIEFFETMGVIIDLKGLHFETVMELFGGWAYGLNDLCGAHIKERQTTEAGLYVHASVLLDKASTWCEQYNKNIDKKRERLYKTFR